MKRTTLIPAVAAAILVVVAGAATAQARVDFHVNIDVPVVAPAPPVVPAGYGYNQGSPWPVMQPELVMNEAPRFIYSPSLGFHVSVGAPYDIVYVNNGYYLYRGGAWYLASSYRGPWSIVSHRRLPLGLRTHGYDQICHHRDHEYRTYLRDRDHYRGSWHRPVVVQKVGHRDHGWYDRQHDKQHRKEHIRNEREHRREHRKDEREHRRDDRRDHRDDHRDGRDRR